MHNRGEQLPLNEIIQGDCLNVMVTLPDNSIDMIFTDPPYGHNNNNNGDLISRWEAATGKGDYIPSRDNIPILNDGPEASDIYKAMLIEAKRVLKPGSALCCCCCGGGGPDPQFARWSLWMDAVLEFKQMVIWDKGKIGMGWHYRRSYETVLVATKKGAKCKWFDDSHKIENIIRHIRKIIPNKTQHPTVKPVALAEHFIRLHTQEGDTILDPFTGSGTTALAAMNLNRNYIGIELSQEYCNLAANRISSAEPTLFTV